MTHRARASGGGNLSRDDPEVGDSGCEFVPPERITCAPIRAFCDRNSRKTPSRKLPVQNYFGLGNLPRQAPSRARKSARAPRKRREIETSSRARTWRKAAFHRHFCMMRNFSRGRALRRRFVVAHFAGVRSARAAARAARHLHTKLSRVTVIFFLL
jgi:hypothetical protein